MPAALKSVALSRAHELHVAPPLGQKHSVPLPGSEQPGRTAVYRHWKCTTQLLDTLDPKVNFFAC